MVPTGSTTGRTDARPSLETTPIPGMVVLRLDVREDARGWFKENWQREKMVALGLPDFGPVQNNISFNASAGATRGIHAEPWDKFVSVGTGRVFGAWVDLREGDSFGAVFTVEITPWVAVFVPRGVGNAFQTLEDATSYTYLVNDHWRPGTTYPALALDDATAAIPWPIPLDRAEAVDRERLDITDSAALHAWPWADYDTVVNAAAWTTVDAAEDERAGAWAANATAPAVLAGIARDHRLTLVHYSTDYVFDGAVELHGEDEPVAPLGVYGQSKATASSPTAACLRAWSTTSVAGSPSPTTWLGRRCT